MSSAHSDIDPSPTFDPFDIKVEPITYAQLRARTLGSPPASPLAPTPVTTNTSEDSIPTSPFPYKLALEGATPSGGFEGLGRGEGEDRGDRREGDRPDTPRGSSRGLSLGSSPTRLAQERPAEFNRLEQERIVEQFLEQERDVEEEEREQLEDSHHDYMEALLG
jgi:hypothetical protein